jgi:tartrate-resistant acid phosphatase type 5
MRKIFLLTCVIITLVHIATAQNDNYDKAIATGYKGGVIKDIKAVKKALNFCVIGDWGRYGEPYQKAVAEQMSNAAVGIDATMILSMGDNFYPKGVQSEYDPTWQQSFENVYTTLALHSDWYVCLGNHDYKTNPDAEIAYSKISARWKMPARYFNFTKKINSDSTKTVEFFYIDSSPFQTEYYTNDEYATNVKLTDTVAQKKWLTDALQKSNATWKFVVGHHPLYSAGKRKGKTADMENSFKNLFEQYKVDAYLCGHEHHLEYDEPEGVHFKQIISGAGAEATPVTIAPYAKFVQQDFGFVTASITAKEALFQFINWEGKILYSSSLKK